MECIIIMNSKKQIYFFSTDHCQKRIGKGWTPCTLTLPLKVVPRSSLPDGIVANKEDIKKIFLDDMEEIPNPDPNLQG